ncbi:MAG: hypothetical protein Kow00117_02670 [Phototrophicales bacterium]
MKSFEQLQRQFRFAIIAAAVIFPLGTVGYMLTEDMHFGDALWLTIVTLGTIGYGDLVPKNPSGKVFTILLIFLGLGVVAISAQSAIEFLISPDIRRIRRRRLAERKIKQIKNHFIICGEGELVDKTINYLMRRAELRREHQREAIAAPIQHHLDRFLGKNLPRKIIETLILQFLYWRHRGETILDVIVVITEDEEYANTLSASGLLVVNDDPTDDRTLRRANIAHARAMLVILENDADTLLTVLTARSRNQTLYLTAATQNDKLNMKIIRVGANNVLPPFEIAGQFLNNATLRPVVNDFYNSILFDQKSSYQIVQLYISEGSSWVGKSIDDLQLRERFSTGIIGLRTYYGRYFYAPSHHHVFEAGDIVLAVTPGAQIQRLQQDCMITASPAANPPDPPNWQRIPPIHTPLTSPKIYSLKEAEKMIDESSQHYIICGEGTLVRAALDFLNPARPFIVISHNDNELTSDMMKRGFRVVHGNAAEDETLLRANVKQALAIMIAIEDKAESVLATLNARSMNKELLIIATATSDDMIPRLRRAGADRVVSPFRIAAQFVLLATIRPVVSDFLQHVLYNYQAGIETTELYMQDNTPWIGHTIEETRLGELYKAWVIGVRQTNGRFIYAPSEKHVIQVGEVLVVITPMQHADTIRLIAHGGISQRPKTMRL